MKTLVKKISATKRGMDIEVPSEVVNKIFDEVYVDLSKTVKIKGFRQGNVPRHILESQHSHLAKEEFLKRIIPLTYKEALGKENLTPVDLPEIYDVELKGDNFSYKTRFEIKPEVKLKNYKSLKVTRKKTEVTEEDIKKALEFLRDSQGLDKNTVFDDKFAKGLSYPSFNELKETIKKQLEISKDQQAKFDVENQVIEQLLAEASLELPEAPVKKQLDYMLKDTKMRLSYEGHKKEDIEAKEEELRQQLKPEAEKIVRVYFILEKIAQLENIKVEKDEDLTKRVMEFLLKEAQWQET